MLRMSGGSGQGAEGENIMFCNVHFVSTLSTLSSVQQCQHLEGRQRETQSMCGHTQNIMSV